MSIRIDLSRLPEIINPVYLPLLSNKDRFNVYYGSAGSGKSHFIAQKFLTRIVVGLQKRERHKVFAVRKTQPAVRKSVFALFQNYISQWGLSKLCKINKGDMTISFLNGSEILCGGLDDPEKIKSMEGLTGIWLEEATEFTLNDFRQLNLRLRGKHEAYKQICLSFNPISKKSWVYKEFFEQEKGTKLHTTYKDNQYIDEEYSRELEGLKDQDDNYYKIYALGEWGELVGLVYENWDLVDDLPDGLDDERYGVDFGFNNPTAVIRVGIKDKELYIDQLLYQSKLTNEDLIARLEDMLDSGCSVIKADSAEPDRIEELRRAGFCCDPCTKGKNSVKDGIDRLKRYKIHITRRSVEVIDEIKSYKWRQDKDQKMMDEPVKFNDHAMDAIRYAVGDLEGGVKIWDL